MFEGTNLSIGENNHLMIGRHDAVELARQFGTPLYVLDEDLMRQNCRAYRQAIEEYYDGNGLAIFASKALCTVHTARVAAEEGLGADVVSGGEIYTLRAAGVSMDHVFFHGNNKSREEIAFAMDSGVGYFIVDHPMELDWIEQAAAERGIVQKVLFRIKPGIEAHTHDYVKTGQIDCKFGLALETGEAFEVLGEAVKLPHVQVEGVHCHIGSQVFDVEPFCEAARRMIDFMACLRDELDLPVHMLNLGGGFGIRYEKEDDPPTLAQYMQAVTEAVRVRAAEKNVPLPFLLLEPGRAIVGPAGITLYTAGCVKKIPGARTYVSVDGGMGDNPRYILYGAKHAALVANRAGDPTVGPVTIAGKCCESGDLIREHVPLQAVHSGDIVAVLATGAYNYSMASNYNRLPRPAMVAVRGEEARVIVRRETYADLVRCELE